MRAQKPRETGDVREGGKNQQPANTEARRRKLGGSSGCYPSTRRACRRRVQVFTSKPLKDRYVRGLIWNMCVISDYCAKSPGDNVVCVLSSLGEDPGGAGDQTRASTRGHTYHASPQYASQTSSARGDPCCIAPRINSAVGVASTAHRPNAGQPAIPALRQPTHCWGRSWPRNPGHKPSPNARRRRWHPLRNPRDPQGLAGSGSAFASSVVGRSISRPSTRADASTSGVPVTTRYNAPEFVSE